MFGGRFINPECVLWRDLCLSHKTWNNIFFNFICLAEVYQEVSGVMDVGTLAEKGCAAFKVHDYASALGFYNDAIQVDPLNVRCLCNRSATYTCLHSYEKAEADARLSIKLQPNNAKAWGRLGAALHGQKRYEEAEQAYCEAAKLDPSNPGYATSAKEMEALHKSGHGIASDSTRTEFYFSKSLSEGKAAMVDGNPLEAVRCFTKALQFCPEGEQRAVLLVNRASAHFRASNFDEAIKDCNAALACDPNYSRGFHRLGLAQQAVGDLSAARESFKKAASLAPNNSEFADSFKSVQKLCDDKEADARKKVERLKRSREELEEEAKRVACERNHTAVPPPADDNIRGLLGSHYMTSYSYCHFCNQFGHVTKDCPLKKHPKK